MARPKSTAANTIISTMKKEHALHGRVEFTYSELQDFIHKHYPTEKFVRSTIMHQVKNLVRQGRITIINPGRVGPGNNTSFCLTNHLEKATAPVDQVRVDRSPKTVAPTPQRIASSGNSEDAEVWVQDTDVTDQSPISTKDVLMDQNKKLSSTIPTPREAFENEKLPSSSEVREVVGKLQDELSNVIVTINNALNLQTDNLRVGAQSDLELIKKLFADQVDALSVIQLAVNDITVLLNNAASAIPSNVEDFREGYRLGFKDGIQYTREELRRP